jgi:predicted Zn-dependent peptidase
LVRPFSFTGPDFSGGLGVCRGVCDLLGMNFRKSKLSNGVVVVTETHPTSRAMSAGFWVGVGTRDEPHGLGGIAHFTEHLVFRGSRQRSGFELALALDAVGGELNAYTSRESVCFHATALKDDCELVLDVLCDLVSEASFPAKEYEREREVVLQEILMTEDNPEELAFDLFFEKAYGRNLLGSPILGTAKSLSNIKRSDVQNYYSSYFGGRNLSISISGNIDHDRCVEYLEKRLKKHRGHVRPKPRRQATMKSFCEFIEKDSEQNQILVGIETTSYKSERRFEAFILNALLGGGMTSKLYQTIREKQGLAYSIYSQLTTFTDTGMVTVYAGTDAKFSRKVLELILKELEKLKKRRVSKAEVDLFKKQVRGSILLGADDIENRMQSLGINEMVFGEYRSVDRVIFELDSVTVDSMNAFIEKEMNLDKLSILVLGREGSLSQSSLEKMV